MKKLRPTFEQFRVGKCLYENCSLLMFCQRIILDSNKKLGTSTTSPVCLWYCLYSHIMDLETVDQTFKITSNLKRVDESICEVIETVTEPSQSLNC